MASVDVSIKEIYNTGKIKRSKKHHKLYENYNICSKICYFSKNTKLLLSDEKLLRLGWRYFASESRGMMKDRGAI